MCVRARKHNIRIGGRSRVPPRANEEDCAGQPDSKVGREGGGRQVADHLKDQRGETVQPLLGRPRHRWAN